MFSKSCEYAIKAMIYIVSESLEGNRVKVNSLAQEIGVPEAFMGKIMSQLAQKQLVESLKGPYGGYQTSTSHAKKMSIIDVIHAVDGSQILEGCALSLSSCDEKNPCPMHEQFAEIRQSLKFRFGQKSMYDLAVELRKGKTVLVR